MTVHDICLGYTHSDPTDALPALVQIYDRDGLTLGEFVKGDMYIRDLKNTKGHISGLTCGEWHPKDKQTILTSSEDGSLRIWDVNDFKSQKQVTALTFLVAHSFIGEPSLAPDGCLEESSAMYIKGCEIMLDTFSPSQFLKPSETLVMNPFKDTSKTDYMYCV